jgi:hypothetical protein
MNIMGIEFTVGTKTKIELISANHGAVRVPLAQSFDYTPSFDEKRIFEFDRDEVAAIVTNFNGVEIRFDHFDSDSKLVDAAVNDLNPTATALVDDPTGYQDLNIIVNVRKKSDNKIFQSVLCKAVRLTGAAVAEPVRDEATISRSGVATNVLRIKGVGIEYTRALRAASTAFAQGAANSRVDKVAAIGSGADSIYYVWTVDHTPTAVTANSAINGSALIYILKNGTEYTGAVISGSTIKILLADFTANDVFEAYTTYVES